MDKEFKSKIKKVEERIEKLEYYKKTLDKINKVVKDFWDSNKDCDDVDALRKIIKIMEKYNIQRRKK